MYYIDGHLFSIGCSLKMGPKNSLNLINKLETNRLFIKSGQHKDNIGPMHTYLATMHEHVTYCTYYIYIIYIVARKVGKLFAITWVSTLITNKISSDCVCL